jgi:dTMP kinase
MSQPGRLVVFEGIDGCGKSTQVARVAASRGALATFEPGDTTLGAALRAVVLDPSTTMTPLAEALVMAADRAQHLDEVVEPALAAGRDVVCDRYSGSTIAYQGFGRGVPVDQLQSMLDVATRGRDPDVTILLDCPVEVGRARRATRGTGADRFESADGDFLDRVRQGFLELASSSPRWRVLESDVELDVLSSRVDEVLDAALRR